jgi:hypothetical protein
MASRSALGVSYTTNNLELIKRLGAQRSVIYPNQEEGPASTRQREGEALTGLGTLGADLDEFLHSLRSPANPYPLLRDVLLDYVFLRPPEQSPKSGRMYVMYVGELHWRFPAPLLADMLRLRVTHRFPQPVKDLLTTVLVRWGRDHIEGPSRPSPSLQREEIAGWLDDLDAPDVLRARWRRDQLIKKLMLADLHPDHITALQRLAERGDVRTRVAAVRILATGGHTKDPDYFAGLLRDPAIEVQHAAFWGLVYMPGSTALPFIQGYTGRAQAIGARLNELRAGVTAEVVREQVTEFDQAVAAVTGKRAVAAEPYRPGTSPADLFDQGQSTARAPRELVSEEEPEPMSPQLPEPGPVAPAEEDGFPE